MTAPATATKETLYDKIRGLSDSEATQVINFIDSLDEHEPNEETAAVLRESDAGLNLIGPFNSLEEMFRDFGIDADTKSYERV